ncbi:MAG: hypothetical protein AAFZ18_40115 [Myxococcota bacterium]
MIVIGGAVSPFILRALNEAKMAEGRANLEAIVAGLEKLRADHGGFVSLAAYPDPHGLSVAEQLWSVPPCPTACSREGIEGCASFDCVGFHPHGDDAFFSYACRVSTDGQAVTCAALGDLDGDGQRSLQVRRRRGPKGEVAPIPSFGGLAPECSLSTEATTSRCPEAVY